MPSGRLFPSRVQSLYRNLKLLAFQLTGAGASAPTLPANLAQGVASVSRTSAGLYVIKLADQYPQIIEGQLSLKYASAPAGTLASITEGTSNAAWKVTAGAGFPGVLGNNLTVAILTDTTLATTYTLNASGGVDMAVALATAGSAVTAVITNFNTTIPAAVAVMSIPSGTGATNMSAQAGVSLAGGLSGQLSPSFGAIDVVTHKTVAINLQDPNSGSATDLPVGACLYVELALLQRS